MWVNRASLVFALAALAGLGCDRVPADAVTECESAVRIGAVTTDILFVVDDSASMEQEQRNLRDSLGAFADALASSPVRNDFQVGVTTTAVEGFGGETDVLYPAVGPYAGLGYRVPYPAGRLVAVDSGALASPALEGKLQYDPAPADAFVGPRILASGSSAFLDGFKTNVLVGTLGSNKEQPLRAARAALEGRIADGTNAGFLRDGARLALVFLTDEDDCSESLPPYVDPTTESCADPSVKESGLDPLADFESFLEVTLADRQPVVAVIAGFSASGLVPEVCRTTLGEARDAPTRLRDLLDALPADRAIRASICAAFNEPLLAVADRLVPQTVPLEGTPPDYRMLVVSVRKSDGSVVPCPVAAAGAPEAGSAAAIYDPPQAGRGATLTLQGACTLHYADRLDLRLVCAG
jgi:hypothetical protein